MSKRVAQFTFASERLKEVAQTGTRGDVAQPTIMMNGLFYPLQTRCCTCKLHKKFCDEVSFSEDASYMCFYVSSDGENRREKNYYFISCTSPVGIEKHSKKFAQNVIRNDVAKSTPANRETVPSFGNSLSGGGVVRCNSNYYDETLEYTGVLFLCAFRNGKSVD